ncbi:MAG: hypothetical protein D6775_01300 [Caldilineae bacterium]|nr:MAG: hypothetical protein D6775_01300 [Caldilineae bacterium]
MLAQILTEPGFGGLIVMVVLIACLSFYGSLILWIARAREQTEEPLRRARRPKAQQPELEGARS